MARGRAGVRACRRATYLLAGSMLHVRDLPSTSEIETRYVLGRAAPSSITILDTAAKKNAMEFASKFIYKYLFNIRRTGSKDTLFRSVKCR